MAKALPLEGIRVANFGWVWAGPITGQTLSFLGAEVYKIESNARLDLTRRIPWQGEEAPIAPALYAGPGSISLNFQKPEARELAHRFVALSDVAVENFGAGTADRLDLGYERLREIKPDIVYLAMPAAGQTGPLRHVITYGTSLASITGFESVTGYPGGAPHPAENAYADPFNGVMGAFAVMAGLQYRKRTGKGQFIDYSQQEAVAQFMGPAFMEYFMNDRDHGPMGNRHPYTTAAPHGVFPCAGEDRWISLVVYTDEEWRGLVTAMDSPSWAAEPAFADASSRLEHIDALHEHIAAWTAGQVDRALAEALQRHGVAAAPVLDIAGMLDDPNYRARKTWVEIAHRPGGYKGTVCGNYVKMSRTEPPVKPAPAVGQDNEHVFKDLLGLSADEYDRLVEQQVIF